VSPCPYPIVLQEGCRRTTSTQRTDKEQTKNRQLTDDTHTTNGQRIDNEQTTNRQRTDNIHTSNGQQTDNEMTTNRQAAMDQVTYRAIG
jgi:hypothetical protein